MFLFWKSKMKQLIQTMKVNQNQFKKKTISKPSFKHVIVNYERIIELEETNATINKDFLDLNLFFLLKVN